MSPAFSCSSQRSVYFRSSSHSRCVADLFIKEIIESPVFFTQTGSMPCIANLHDYAASGAKEANPPLASSHAEAMDMRAEVSPLAVCPMLQKHSPDRRILRELPASSTSKAVIAAGATLSVVLGMALHQSPQPVALTKFITLLRA